MTKHWILIIILILFLSGCLAETVKKGDTVSIGFIAKYENGTVFDSSNETVARDNNAYIEDKQYGPLNFTVGGKHDLDEEVIGILDEGVVGMKVGKKKTLKLPPEKAYGTIDTNKLELIPIIQEIPATSVINKMINFSIKDFNRIFGENHTVGDVVRQEKSIANLTIVSMDQDNVKLAYRFKIGDTYEIKMWNLTVTDANETFITLKTNLKLNETNYFFNGIWNSTVINISDTKITFRHNPERNKKVLNLKGKGQIDVGEIDFNETHIIINYNHPLAGKTLLYEIELFSIMHPERKD